MLGFFFVGFVVFSLFLLELVHFFLFGIVEVSKKMKIKYNGI